LKNQNTTVWKSKKSTIQLFVVQLIEIRVNIIHLLVILNQQFRILLVVKICDKHNVLILVNSQGMT